MSCDVFPHKIDPDEHVIIYKNQQLPTGLVGPTHPRERRPPMLLPEALHRDPTSLCEPRDNSTDWLRRPIVYQDHFILI